MGWDWFFGVLAWDSRGAMAESRRGVSVRIRVCLVGWVVVVGGLPMRTLSGPCAGRGRLGEDAGAGFF